MDATVLAQQFGQLRARIEASFTDSALLVVTSAKRGDGKTAAAFGLAESLAQADHRVLLVDANVEAPVLPRTHRLPISGANFDISNVSRYAAPVGSYRFKGVSFADERLEWGLSLEKIRAAAFDMRSHFDYVIVDTAQLLHSDMAVLLSTIADGTLLTVRLGRLPSSSDEQAVKTLTRVGASILGVVSVTSAMIKEFAAERDQTFTVPQVSPRHVTTRHTLEADAVRDVIETPRKTVVS